MTDLYQLSSYDYALPEDRIAQVPASPADTSRLLIREPDGTLRESVFSGIGDEVADDRVMFFNNSKVIPSRIPLPGARLVTRDGREKIFDGEVFFLEETGTGSFKSMVYPGDYFPVWGIVSFDNIAFKVEEIVYEGRILSLVENMESAGSPHSREPALDLIGGWQNNSIWQVLEQHGQLPLPPYIEYSKEKEAGYQPIFAEKRGSLAAPTASLHFTERVIASLDLKEIERHTITLHVGLGTFKNIYEEDIRDYEMHAERAEVPTSLFETVALRKHGGKTILAVGTTVTRTLESLPYLWALVRDQLDFMPEVRAFWDTRTLVRETNPLSSVSFSPDGKTIFFSSALFIYAAYPFQIVDEIVTNFHLPKSTLFILVSSFLGLDATRKLYAHAVEERYRFFSFGDAMYLKK